VPGCPQPVRHLVGDYPVPGGITNKDISHEHTSRPCRSRY
jgi:hypothetical protein